MIQFTDGVKNVASKRKRLIIALLIIAVIAIIGIWRFKASQQNKPQYQTAAVQKGTLVKSVSASGQITTGDSVAILTQSSGLVKDVLVKNGDSVAQGQVIADLTLDQSSQQKQAAAYASWLSAENSLNSANANLNTLQNTEFTANQKFINDAVARGLATDDPTYVEENAAWLAAEANYKNQQQVISQTQAAVNSASLALQQTASTITAPAAGIVSGLIITPGTSIAAAQTTSGTSATSTNTTVGNISQTGPIQAEVNVAEIDSVNVGPGQKATLTLDVFPGKTFTGKVLIVNTNGVVSSGVATYPAIIAFDTSVDHVYPNMAVTASIITKVDSDVLLLPSAAVQTQNNQTTVRILQNGKLQSVPVQTGDSNDTETEITSGLNEGDSVITAVISPTTQSTGAATSPFGGGLRGFGGGGGGAVRVGGGGAAGR